MTQTTRYIVIRAVIDHDLNTDPDDVVWGVKLVTDQNVQVSTDIIDVMTQADLDE